MCAYKLSLLYAGHIRIQCNIAKYYICRVIKIYVLLCGTAMTIDFSPENNRTPNKTYNNKLYLYYIESWSRMQHLCTWWFSLDAMAHVVINHRPLVVIAPLTGAQLTGFPTRSTKYNIINNRWWQINRRLCVVRVVKKKSHNICT